MSKMHRRLCALAILLPLGACTAPNEEPADGSPQRSVDPEPTRGSAEPLESVRLEPVPWTDHFVSPAVLVADRIRVEGPAGLLEHLALRSDDALFERTVNTVPEGFLQTIRPRLLADGGREVVRGQLDAWQLAATREIVTLERPGDVSVLVIGEGDASWRDTDGQEQRGPRLVFRATIEPLDEAAEEGAAVDGAAVDGAR